MAKPIIIAEFGSSPAPDWDFHRWCQVASFAGADAVKVQLFKAEHFMKSAKIGLQYSKDIFNQVVNWYDVVDDKEVVAKKPLEFPRRRWFDFVEVAHSYGLQAGASVFDVEAVDIVARDGDFIKLAAREQGNKKLLDEVLVKREKYVQVYRSISEGKFWGHNYDSRTIHFAAVQEYPTSVFTAVKKLIAWSRFFEGVKWGWSSHTKSIIDCWMAVKLGASVVEKHLCLSPKDIEAEHSLLPKDFQKMVKLCKS